MLFSLFHLHGQRFAGRRQRYEVTTVEVTVQGNRIRFLLCPTHAPRTRSRPSRSVRFPPTRQCPSHVWARERRRDPASYRIATPFSFRTPVRRQSPACTGFTNLHRPATTTRLRLDGIRPLLDVRPRAAGAAGGRAGRARAPPFPRAVAVAFPFVARIWSPGTPRTTRPLRVWDRPVRPSVVPPKKEAILDAGGSRGGRGRSFWIHPRDAPALAPTTPRVSTMTTTLALGRRPTPTEPTRTRARSRGRSMAVVPGCASRASADGVGPDGPGKSPSWMALRRKCAAPMVKSDPLHMWM